MTPLPLLVLLMSHDRLTKSPKGVLSICNPCNSIHRVTLNNKVTVPASRPQMDCLLIASRSASFDSVTPIGSKNANNTIVIDGTLERKKSKKPSALLFLSLLLSFSCYTQVVFMALKLYSTYVLGHRYHGLSCHCSNAHLTFHSPGLHPISSNRRRRNYSSQNRKQPLKRIPRRRPPVDLKFQQSEDENADGQTSITDGVSDSHQDSGSNAGFDSTAVIENSNEADFGNATDVQKAITDEVSDYQQDAGSNSGSYSNTVIEISDETDFETATLAVETKSLAEDADGEEQLTNIRLEDLISMIKNAEKNVLLLNEARVRALEDLDKILIEKDSLQGEIDILEMRLAETDAKMNVAAEEKINVELLEDQLESLKNEMSKREYSSKYILYEDNTKIPNLESPVLHDSGINAISMELDVVRKENLSLKDDIQTLKAKLAAVEETDERIVLLEKERSSLEASLKELESRLLVAQEDVSKLYYLNSECKALQEKVESLQELLDKANEQADQASMVLQQNYELQMKVDRLEASLKELNSYKSSAVSSQQFDDLLQQKVKLLEERLLRSDEEIHSHVQMYQESMKEFQDTINRLKEESKRRAQDEPVDDMPWEFWSRLLLTIDGWLLEKKISSDDAKLLREMVWKRNAQIRDAYFACKYKSEHDLLPIFLKLLSSGTKSGLHVVHIAAEMAPVAKVGGLGDVVAGLSKALQKRGHLVEIILPKYDCMQYDRIGDLKALDVVVQSYFDGQLFKNKVWVGTIEGLPVYFIEPHHPAKFFWRGQVYGEHDDFKRFSFFSRAALELLLQAGKKPDIIHCHDWQTAFIAPLYWDIYAPKGLNSARICFTCHNFQYQGTAPASELGSCGLDVQQLNRPDRMQDNAAHDRVNPVKGAIVFSNIVTTVSPTYAQEVRAAEGGRGLHGTLISHAKKFVGILNGIDTDTWNPSTDSFLRFQYTADDLQGKAENKDAIRKQLKLSSADVNCPLVGCITRLVAQKGVHLIRHAIYRTLELGGQFVLLGSSPVPHIQREFEGIANHLENNPDVRLILKYDEALSHSIYAASDMFIIPSIFEPCGLTQMIAMRYGSVPIVRKTGGLSDSVFDVDDATIPPQFRNGFTFLNPDEQGLSNAMERAFNHYKKNPENWQQLVQRNMKIDFSWDSAAAQYEELYEKSVSRARAARSHV